MVVWNKCYLKKSGKQLYLDEISSGEDHKMALPLLKNQRILDQRCKSIIIHSSMIVLCNQVFTYGTFML